MRPGGRLSIAVAAMGLAHLLLIIGATPLILQSLAALALTVFIPGALLITWYLGDSETPPATLEWSVYAIGAGYGVLVVTMLALSYVPGALYAWHVAFAFDAISVVLLILLLRRGNRKSTPLSAASRADRNTWLLMGLLTLLLVGGFLRFTNLGYSEFHGDEARAALRAAAVIQGYDDVLLIHRKGPAEILIPTAIYSLTGRLTEATARLPFAVANLAGLVAVFVLGWRLFGSIAGWTAAMLLALDGYFIGFSRIVQYQSVVFLTSVLVVLVLYRLTQRPAALTRYLTVAALFLTTGLLSHYEAGFVAVPAFFLLIVVWYTGTGFRYLAGALVLPIGLGLVILTSFFLPFVLHPSFRTTLFYLTEQRIGGRFPYNNLADFFLRTTVYSTTYYLVLMIAVVLITLITAYRRGFGKWSLPLIGVLLLGVAATLWRPDIFVVVGTDYTVVLFVLLLVAGWVTPRLTIEERMLWLWFGVPLLAYLFFTEMPRTHVYTFFPPWSLLVGLTLARGWAWLHERAGARPAITAGIVAVLVSTGIFGSYAYWYFVYNEVEILRTWEEYHPAGFWTVYERPDNRKLYGFPLKNGWKTVGVLYDQGMMDGVYASNQKDSWVTDWYTRGAWRCERDHRYFILADDLELESKAAYRKLRKRLQQDDVYRPIGAVMVHGEPRLQMYQRNDGNETAAPQQFDSTRHERLFDRQLADPYFPLDEPAVRPRSAIGHPVQYKFGEQIQLEGFHIEASVVSPGDSVRVALYWRALSPIAEQYKVFNQIIEPGVAMRGQRDGEPKCEGWPTTNWQPGALVVDRYAVPIFPDAPPGTYPLLVGMYPLNQPSAPLEIYDSNGISVGQAVKLTQIRVLPAE